MVVRGMFLPAQQLHSTTQDVTGDQRTPGTQTHRESGTNPLPGRDSGTSSLLENSIVDVTNVKSNILDTHAKRRANVTREHSLATLTVPHRVSVDAD